MHCEISECVDVPTFHFTRIEGRHPTYMKYFCDNHAHDFLTEFRSNYYFVDSNIDVSAGFIPVDFEMIVHHNGREEKPVLIYFHEIGGSRRFGIMVSECARSALAEELSQQKSKNATHHGTWANSIRLLGGQLQDIVISDLNATDGLLDATLRILKEDQLLEVIAKPSDAFILAAAVGTLILVDKKSFESIVDNGEG